MCKLLNWYCDTKFHKTFHSSEVIWLARIQTFVGVVWQVLIQTDLAPIITNQKYLSYWLIGSGVITEMCRRNREDWAEKEPK